MALVPSMLHPELKDDYSLTAILTSKESSARDTSAKYAELTGHPVKAYHGEVAQLASDPDVQLIAISVKAPNHLAVAMPAIQAGKDVFLEWPAGRNLEEVKAMAEAVKSQGSRMTVGLQGRHSPAFKKMSEIVKSGKIGRVLSSTVIGAVPREMFFWGPWVSENNVYTVDVSTGTSMLHVALGHFLDPFTLLLGNITSVSSTLANRFPTATVYDASKQATEKKIPQTSADQVIFSGTTASGVAFSFHWRAGIPAQTATCPFLWVIDGEEGSVALQNDQAGSSFMNIFEPKVTMNGAPVEDVQADPLGNVGRAWKEGALKGNVATIDDAVQIHRVLDAIKRSSEEGKTIQF